MPIYGYKCNECGHEFEIITQTVKKGEAWENRICPNCLTSDIKKLPSSFIWRFGSMAGDRNERKDK